MNLECTSPVSAQSHMTPIVGVSRDQDDTFSFIVIDANRQTTSPLLLRVSDLHPDVSAATVSRIESWARGSVYAAVEDLELGIRTALAQSHL